MKTIRVLVLTLVLSLLAMGLVRANGAVETSRQVLSGGASDSAATAGNVTLHATLGQPVTGPIASGDGTVSLGQGFWHGGAAAEEEPKVYLPLVSKDI